VSAIPLSARRSGPRQAQGTSPRGDGRLRLLLLTDTPVLGPGGSETFLRHLAEGLDPRRYAIDVVQLCPPPAQAAATLQLPPGAMVRLEYWPVDAVYGAAGRAALHRLRERVKRGDYDVVQSQHEKSDLLCALLPRGPAATRRISSRRDTGFQKSWRLRLAAMLLNHRFDAVTAPAQAVLAEVRRREGGLRGTRLAIPNGVDPTRFRPLLPEARSAGRATLGLAPDEFAFACVARLVEVKRHCDLLHAFTRLGSGALRPRLLLFGDGPLRPLLERQALDAGIGDRVDFLGERADVAALLPLCDAFVLASRTEGMSNAAIEAMACGLPVVATAVGGQPELLEDGVTGLLVPPRSPARLGFALEQLLHAPPRSHRMGRLGRERVLQSFSVESMVQAHDALYASLRAQDLPA
jgi:glycosyltransferase involved in cell wall biosynthesis